MALVTRFSTNVHALIFNEEQRALLKDSFCSQFATHCLNTKLRELNQEENATYDRKWFSTQKPHFAVTQVGVIVEKDKISALSGVQFFENEKQALEKLKKKLSKHPMAKVITVALYINVPKSEQKNNIDIWF